MAFANQAAQDVGGGPRTNGLAQMGLDRRSSSLTNFFPGGGSFCSTFAGAGFTIGPTSSTTDEETALKASRFCRTFSSSV
jgi:hypothetical protein